jgi:hypothetical protein
MTLVLVVQARSLNNAMVSCLRTLTEPDKYDLLERS